MFKGNSHTRLTAKGQSPLESLYFLSFYPQTEAAAAEEAEEDVMATGELNPNHYPAQRAAKVVQHYLNTRHGSPYRLFGLKQVHSGNAEVRFIFTPDQPTFINVLDPTVAPFGRLNRMWQTPGESTSWRFQYTRSSVM